MLAQGVKHLLDRNGAGAETPEPTYCQAGTWSVYNPHTWQPDTGGALEQASWLD